ncbi:MAG: O-antigen ligase family protein [Thermomicrobiales bacterium]
MLDNIRAVTLATICGIAAISLLYATEPVPIMLAFVIFAVLVTLAAWQPIVVLGLVAASLPLYHQPFEAGTSQLAPSELLLLAAALGTAARATRPDQLRRMRDFVLTRLGRLVQPFGVATFVALALLTVAGLGLLALVEDPDARSAGLRELRWTVIEPLLFVALLIWNTSRRKEQAFVVGAFIAGGFLVGIWGLIDGAVGGGVSAGGVLRVDGPFPHPNAYAMYLLRPVVLAVAYLVVTRTNRPLPWIACGIGGASLVASFSRSAALGLIVAGILLWPWLSPRLRLAGGLAATVLGLALVLVATDRAVGSSGTDSLALRLDIWQSGLAMVRDRPILGYGPDQFLYVYSPRYIDPAAWSERFTAHSHNLLIDAWVRVGIIGAVLVALALARIVRAAVATASAAKRENIDVFAMPAAITLAASFMQGMVDNGYFVHDLAMSAWLIAWIAFAKVDIQTWRGTRLHERYRDRRGGTRWLAPL